MIRKPRRLSAAAVTPAEDEPSAWCSCPDAPDLDQWEGLDLRPGPPWTAAGEFVRFRYEAWSRCSAWVTAESMPIDVRQHNERVIVGRGGLIIDCSLRRYLPPSAHDPVALGATTGFFVSTAAVDPSVRGLMLFFDIGVGCRVHTVSLKVSERWMQREDLAALGMQFATQYPVDALTTDSTSIGTYLDAEGSTFMTTVDGVFFKLRDGSEAELIGDVVVSPIRGPIGLLSEDLSVLTEFGTGAVLASIAKAS